MLTHAPSSSFLSAFAISASVVCTGAWAETITCGTDYTVVSGDTLSKISQAAYGSFLYQPIFNANVDVIGTNPDRIYIGQVFQIPCLTADTADSAADGVTVDSLVLTFSRPSAPPFVINSDIIDVYLASITEATEGRVTFVDPDEVVRDHARQFELVTAGEVDGAYILNAHLAETHPLLQLPMLPMFGGSAEQTAVSLWRLHDMYLSQTEYFPEAEVLGFVSAPAAHIWRDQTAPVSLNEGIADSNMYHEPYFFGLDVRGPAAMREEFAEMQVQHAAASDTPSAYFMAHGAALATGLWSAGSQVAVTEVDNGLYTPTFSVVLSNDAWAQISPEDQAAIRSVSGEVLAHRSGMWDAFDNGFRAKMLREGLIFAKADKALLDELWLDSFGELQAWVDAADSRDIAAREAINSYLANLRSLEDRLIYRADETFVDQHPFVTSAR